MKPSLNRQTSLPGATMTQRGVGRALPQRGQAIRPSSSLRNGYFVSAAAPRLGGVRTSVATSSGSQGFFLTRAFKGLNGLASRHPFVLLATNLILIPAVGFGFLHNVFPPGEFIYNAFLSFQHAWQWIITPLVAFVGLGLFSANFMRANPRVEVGKQIVELSEADLHPPEARPEVVRRRNAENGTPISFASHLADRHKGFSIAISFWNWLLTSIPLLNWVPLKWFGAATLVGAATANLIGLVPFGPPVFLYLTMFPVLAVNRIIHELFLSQDYHGRPPGYPSLSNTFWEFGHRRPLAAAVTVALGFAALGFSGAFSLGLGVGGAILGTALYGAVYAAFGMRSRKNPQARPPLTPFGALFEMALNKPRQATVAIVGMAWLLANPILNVATQLLIGHPLNAMGAGLADFYQFGYLGPFMLLMLVSAAAQLIAGRGSRLLLVRAILSKTHPKLPQFTAAQHRRTRLLYDLWEGAAAVAQAGGLPLVGGATLVELLAAMRYAGDSGLTGFIATIAKADPTGIIDTLILIIFSLYPFFIYGYAKRYKKDRPSGDIYLRGFRQPVGLNEVWQPPEQKAAAAAAAAQAEAQREQQPGKEGGAKAAKEKQAQKPPVAAGEDSSKKGGKTPAGEATGKRPEDKAAAPKPPEGGERPAKTAKPPAAEKGPGDTPKAPPPKAPPRPEGSGEVETKPTTMPPQPPPASPPPAASSGDASKDQPSTPPTET